VGGGPGDLDAVMFERRVLFVREPLDQRQSSDLGARLMALDAMGDDHIDLRITAQRGDVDAAQSLMDVISVIGVPVHTHGTGVVGGPAVGILVAGTHRRLSVRCHLRLFHEPATTTVPVRQLEQFVATERLRQAAFYASMAEATGLDRQEVEALWQRGCVLSPEEALELGFVDEIAD
jgi:ATP-dependent protease ClpP protease subunit